MTDSIVVDDKDTPKVFPFLELPAEIRNKIYRYSLVEDVSADRIEGLVQPPLTRANKQIRSEALPIYYAENKFLLHISGSLYECDDEVWPDFVRMFRIFKAGGINGRGTGSLRFIQNIECQFFNIPRYQPGYWYMEFTLSAVPKRDEDQDGDQSVEDGPCEAYYGTNCAWHDWDFVVRCVEDFLTEREFPSSVMHESSVQNLVSTIVMVASECTGVARGVELELVGKLWVSREDSD